MKPIEQYLDYYDKIMAKNPDWDRIAPMIQGYFMDCDFYQFSWEQLKHLNFTVWDEKETLLLVPSFFFNCIQQGTKIQSINGDDMEFDKEVCDDDTRYGYLAYGLTREEHSRIHAEIRDNNINDIINE